MFGSKQFGTKFFDAIGIDSSKDIINCLMNGEYFCKIAINIKNWKNSLETGTNCKLSQFKIESKNKYVCNLSERS